MKKCELCDKRGRLGNATRLYVISTPLVTTEILLCWKCASARMDAWKRSKKFTIQDKVHGSSVLVGQS